MPSTADRSASNSSCSFLKTVLTPKVLFLTFIISIALTIRPDQYKEDTNCVICTGIKIAMRTATGLMDIFIMIIRSTMNHIIGMKNKFDMLLQKVRSRSTAIAVSSDPITLYAVHHAELSEEERKSTGELKSVLHGRTLSIEESRETKPVIPRKTISKEENREINPVVRTRTQSIEEKREKKPVITRRTVSIEENRETKPVIRRRTLSIEENKVTKPVVRRILSIEENRETFATRQGPGREPGPSDEDGPSSFIGASYKTRFIDNRPSRTKPIPSYVVIPQVSKTANDVANKSENHETVEPEDEHIQDLEEEMVKTSTQYQEPESTRVWRSESQDGPKELFELTKPVPVYADDGQLLGYEDGKGGVMQWDQQHGGYYLDENGDMITLDEKDSQAESSAVTSKQDLMQRSISHVDSKLSQRDSSPVKSIQELAQRSSPKVGSDFGTDSHDDIKKRLALTFSDEDWAANCDCVDDKESKKSFTNSGAHVNCNSCNDDVGELRLTPSSLHWASECKCNDANKVSVSTKSIQTPQEVMKEESVVISKVESEKQLSQEPEKLSEVPKEVTPQVTKYTGPWRSESLDGPKQFNKGESGGLTKKEELEYFLKEGKCSQYDDTKCKRCRCYRTKFTQDQFNEHVNTYKGCLANTGSKRKRKSSVRLSKDIGKPLDISLGRLTTDVKSKSSLANSTDSKHDPKALSTELKSIKSLDVPLSSSTEAQCYCNSTAFGNKDCGCANTDSKHTGCSKCTRSDVKSTSLSEGSDKDALCHCLDSNANRIASKIFSKSLDEIRCRCHDESDAKIVSKTKGKNCKCQDSPKSSSVSQRTLMNNQCSCHDLSDLERVKTENSLLSNDCTCSSHDSNLKSPVLKGSIDDHPLSHKNSKDCSCPAIVSKHSSPVNLINIEPTDKGSAVRKSLSKVTSDAECLAQDTRKHSEKIITESNSGNPDSKSSDTNHPQYAGLITSSGVQTVFEPLPEPKRKSAGAKPINKNVEEEFLKLRAAKLGFNQKQSCMHCPAKEQKRMDTKFICKKKKNKRRF